MVVIVFFVPVTSKYVIFCCDGNLNAPPLSVLVFVSIAPKPNEAVTAERGGQGVNADPDPPFPGATTIIGAGRFLWRDSVEERAAQGSYGVKRRTRSTEKLEAGCCG